VAKFFLQKRQRVGITRPIAPMRCRRGGGLSLPDSADNLDPVFFFDLYSYLPYKRLLKAKKGSKNGYDKTIFPTCGAKFLPFRSSRYRQVHMGASSPAA
jgi:hypothetical protein